MLCLVARRDGDVRRFPLPPREAHLGSAPDNDLPLPVDGVSRRHALVTLTSEGVRLTDLDSKNGLIVDGVRVPSCVLAPGMRVQIGNAIVSVEESDTADVLPALTVLRTVPQRSQLTESLDVRPSEGDALRFIARVERGDVQSQGILAGARRILGAAALQLLRAGGDPEILGSAGSIADDVMNAVAQQACTQCEETIRRIDMTSVLFRAAERTIVVAAFDGPPRILAAWERDFFTWLCGRLLRRDEARDRRRSTTHRASTELVAESPQMRELVATISALAASPEPILLLGETGTGKEVLARLLHETSVFSAGPFIAQNCAALPKELVASELFGTECGVATGVTAREGLFAAAGGGTLFLDEVGEIPQETQAVLLRILEDGELRRVGARASRHLSLRTVLATRREPSESGLREDLYYRCEVLRIPPLRDRRDDIVPLVFHFLERACDAQQIARAAISRKALRALVDHDWPGNVRELKRVVERAVLLYGRGGTLHEDHVRVLLAPLRAPESGETAVPLHAQRDALTRDLILRMLRKTDGNKSEAALRLGMSRNGLLKAMRRLRL